MDRSLQHLVQTLVMVRLFPEQQQQRMVAPGRQRHVVVVVRKTPMAKMVDEKLFQTIAEPTTMTTTTLLPDATGSNDDDDQHDTMESNEGVTNPMHILQQEETTRLVQAYLANCFKPMCKRTTNHLFQCGHSGTDGRRQ